MIQHIQSDSTGVSKKGSRVPETDVTGPLISRRIICVIWQADENMSSLRRYDELRTELNREGGVLQNLTPQRTRK